MKKLFMLSMLAILTLTLVGCGKSGSGASGITDSSQALEEMTLKEALTKKGTQIWYEINTDEDEAFRLDKEQTIQKVFIFKDGKVFITDIRKIKEEKSDFKNQKYSSISLGEIAKMTDEEIIKATEVYKQEQEEWYKYCLDDVAHTDDDESSCDSYKKTINNFNKYEPITFGIITDSTGNNTQTEYFSTKTYKKIWAQGDIKGNYGPYQIYDTYFCGYQDYDFYDGEFDDDVFITKCKSNSVYTLDKVGTKGISIDED